MRRGRLRLRIEMDHVLEAAYLADPDQPTELPTASIEQLKKERSWPWWMLQLVRLAIKKRDFGIMRGQNMALTHTGFARGRCRAKPSIMAALPHRLCRCCDQH